MATDDVLVENFNRDQSDRAFRALFDSHGHAMYALALRLVGGRADAAADVVQEAWTRIVPRFSTFRRQSSLRTWLCGFVINCAREHFRQPWFDELVDLPMPHAAPPELSLDLERALASLADGYRAVIVLHDIEGYTHREIALALNIDEGTSKSQLSRGREVLRRRLRTSTTSMR